MTILSVDMEGISGIFAMDSSSGKAYRLPLEEADPETAGRLAMAVFGQMSMKPYEVPHEQLKEVMRAEKSVAEESRKQYKRNDR